MLKINWAEAPLVVGTVTTSPGLRHLQKSTGAADVIEVRVDALFAAGFSPVALKALLQKRKKPVLLTLRLPAEGGLYAWQRGERLFHLAQLGPEVEAIDIELASLKEFRSITRFAQTQGVKLVLSAHALQKPATPAQIKKWSTAMQAAQPDIAKIATPVGSTRDLQNLARLLWEYPAQRWALMGLGTKAAGSRLALTALGSALIYGYLDQPAASGQPSASALRRALTGLRG